MRYLAYFFLLFLFFQNQKLTAQPCSTVDVILSTQGQVDSFRINYPWPCTQLAKSLIISGEDITNLDSLIGIDFIGKDLIIDGCPLLTSLRGLDSLVVTGRHVKIQNNLMLFDVGGLEALQSIIGQLWIRNNPSLQNLNGLANLSGVIGNFRLEDNTALTDISGLGNLGAVGGNFVIKNNTSLPNLYNLRKLSSIGGSFTIQGNTALMQVSDLSHLTSVGGHLIILQNASLQSVMGFIHLTSINGYLYIRLNPNLPTLLGLDNIDPAGIIYLIIKDNAALSLCSVTSVCEYLAMGIGPYLINGNPADCSNEPQVTALCLVLPIRFSSFDARKVDEGVLLDWETALENESEGFFVQRSSDLKTWESLAFIPSQAVAGGGAKYNFLDDKPPLGTVFYRLEQMDFSGKSTYSEVVSVSLGEAFRQMQVYPNPTAGVLFVEPASGSGLSANEQVTYKLYDHTGQLMDSGSLSGGALDLSRFSPGLYWLNIQTGSESSVLKVVLE